MLKMFIFLYKKYILNNNNNVDFKNSGRILIFLLKIIYNGFLGLLKLFFFVELQFINYSQV